MLQSTRFRLAATGVAITGAVALIGMSGAGSEWEYGELVVSGDEAIFVTQEATHELKTPTQINPGGQSAQSNWGRVHYRTSLKILHLNRLGSEGWELLDSSAIEQGSTYTMRRRR